MAGIQSYYNQQHAILSLYLTNRCNIACRHCGVSSGPKENSRLDVKAVAYHLSALKATGIIKALHVSGGEPFLFLEDLTFLGESARELDLLFCVNTNAFWARSEQDGVRTLQKIPGLSQLFLSTDVYHAEFLPPNRVVNAVRACLARGIEVAVGICTQQGQRTDFVDQIEGLLGPELIKKISFGTNSIELGGRANSLTEANWRAETTELPTGACRLINRPVVLETGDVLACCNTTVAAACKKSSLTLGNICDDSLTTILKRGREDPVLQLIRILGPAFLVRLLTESERTELKGVYREGDICSACVDLMSRPMIAARLRVLSESDTINKLLSAVSSLGIV